MKKISNDKLSMIIKEKGAELTSLVCNKTNREYIWNADPKYWNRHSPILFPIVGSLWNGEYRLKGECYNLPQHGFARDMDFKIVKETNTELVLQLENNQETEKTYPFSFKLSIGYKLIDKTICISWNVKNTGKGSMFFQIGAHPGFFYPNFNAKEKLKGFLRINTSSFNYTLLGEKGCIPHNSLKRVDTNDNLFPIMDDTFDNQAMIIENGQLSKITLLDSNKNSYLTVRFNAPVVGIWSPPSKNAPFICIEPWFGRCDYIDYYEEFNEKEWINKLNVNEEFNACYYIDIDN